MYRSTCVRIKYIHILLLVLRTMVESRQPATATLHRILPLSLQRALRDTGGTRYVFDGAATLMAGTIAAAKPGLALRFLSLRSRTIQQAYGDHPAQRIEIIPAVHAHTKDSTNTCNNECDSKDTCKRILAFVHGGAWGSGRPWMYRLIADTLTHSGYTVVIIGYRTFPDGDANIQVEDIGSALTSLEAQGLPVYICGHSSGAHIAAMYLLRRVASPELYTTHPHISGFIGLSGVYDIHKHYLYESWRGVHEVSPMKVANGGTIRSFLKYSPCRIVARRLNLRVAERFPPSLLIHGTQDDTVPFTSTEEFGTTLRARGVHCDTLFLQGGDHFISVGQLMFAPLSEVEVAISKLCDGIEKGAGCKPVSKL